MRFPKRNMTYYKNKYIKKHTYQCYEYYDHLLFCPCLIISLTISLRIQFGFIMVASLDEAAPLSLHLVLDFNSIDLMFCLEDSHSFIFLCITTVKLFLVLWLITHSSIQYTVSTACPWLHLSKVQSKKLFLHFVTCQNEVNI